MLTFREMVEMFAADDRGENLENIPVMSMVTIVATPHGLHVISQMHSDSKQELEAAKIVAGLFDDYAIEKNKIVTALCRAHDTRSKEEFHEFQNKLQKEVEEEEMKEGKDDRLMRFVAALMEAASNREKETSTEH